MLFTQVTTKFRAERISLLTFDQLIVVRLQGSSLRCHRRCLPASHAVPCGFQKLKEALAPVCPSAPARSKMLLPPDFVAKFLLLHVPDLEVDLSLLKLSPTQVLNANQYLCVGAVQHN